MLKQPLIESIKYFFLIAGYTFSNAHQLTMKGNILSVQLNKSVVNITSQSYNGSAYKDSVSNTSIPKYALVFLHGCGMNNQEVGSLAGNIKNLVKEPSLIIFPSCRENEQSLKLSIDKQARKVIQQIEKKLRDQFPKLSDKEIQNFPINIIGYSQGGLVTAIIGERYRHRINIKSLIIVHAPLSGLPLLNNSYISIHKFKKNAKEGLKACNYNTKSKAYVYMWPCLMILQITKFFYHKGLKDMWPDANVIKRTIAFIHNESHHIPVYIVAGFVYDAQRYLDFKKDDADKVDKFINAYSCLITGQHIEVYQKNDLLIPLSSQLAKKPNFNYCDILGYKLAYPKNITIHIDHIAHCYNFFPLDGLKLKSSKIILDTDEGVKNIVKFLAEHNRLTIKN